MKELFNKQFGPGLFILCLILVVFIPSDFAVYFFGISGMVISILLFFKRLFGDILRNSEDRFFQYLFLSCVLIQLRLVYFILSGVASKIRFIWLGSSSDFSFVSAFLPFFIKDFLFLFVFVLSFLNILWVQEDIRRYFGFRRIK